jgi:tetratricopeptide (TPR) repeat protein
MTSSKVVFISYSSKDIAIANEICSMIEKNGMDCWIAPRDVTPGSNYGKEIVDAIKASKVMVLIFSGYSNKSKHVANEIDIAFNNEKTIIPFKIEDIAPGDLLEYYLGNKQWIAASHNPRQYFCDLLNQLNKLIPRPGTDPIPVPIPVHKSDPRKNVRRIALGLTAVLILLLTVFLLRNTGSKPVVQNLVVIDGITLKNNGGSAGELTPDMITYLITDNLQQATNKRILTSAEFQKIYEKRQPELIIEGELSANNIGYSLKVIFRKPNGRKKDVIYDFADPAALLKPIEGYIHNITMNIVELTNGSLNRKTSTFTNSWDSFKLFYNGERAWEKLDITNAEACFKNALTYDDNFILDKLRYAQLLIFNEYNLEAKKIIQQIKPYSNLLSELDSLKIEAISERLQCNFYQENNILKYIYDRYPTRKECAYEVAESYFAKCDVENAITYYTLALKLDSNFALAHNHMAYCYSHMGFHKKAFQHFSKYLKLDSTANSFDSFGDGLMSAGSLDSAEMIKYQGIKLDSELYYLWGSLGYIHLRQGKFAAAEKDFLQYMKKAEGNRTKAKAYFRLALIPYYQGKYQDAMSLCLKAKNLYDTIDIVTRDHELHWMMGILYLKLGQTNKAEEELRIMKMIADTYKISSTNYQINFFKFILHLDIAIKAYHADLPGIRRELDEFDNFIKNKVKDHTSDFDVAFFNNSFGELMLIPALNNKTIAEQRFAKALDYNHNYALAEYNLWKLFKSSNNNELANEHCTKFKNIWKDADQNIKAVYGI